MRAAALALVVLAAAAAPARADVFAFKDLDGFEKCMQLDHLVETIKTDKGAQTRVLGPDEIQPRCIEAAAKLLAQAKNKDMAFDFVKATKRLSAHVNALELINVLVDLSLPHCNQMEVYDVLMEGLEVSKDDTGPYLKRARAAIKKCLKDKDFKKDFVDEKDSANEYRAANACQILLDEKIVKSCKGGKP